MTAAQVHAANGEGRYDLDRLAAKGPGNRNTGRWLQMLEERNLTSHAYHEALATQIYRPIVQDYAPLLSTMADIIQTLQWD